MKSPTIRSAETAFDSGLYVCQQLASEILRLFDGVATSDEFDADWLNVDFIARLSSRLAIVRDQVAELDRAEGGAQ